MTKSETLFKFARIRFFLESSDTGIVDGCFTKSCDVDSVFLKLLDNKLKLCLSKTRSDVLPKALDTIIDNVNAQNSFCNLVRTLKYTISKTSDENG